ncbi:MULTISPECIES: helix-turn-helix transcriptional regulator [Nocardia]|uniref:helix-turn-helix transcriptional regulator n=1 Tax=Nocardia TaxID=1817 RepID=UPI00135CC0EB|nr:MULTISPECIES: transcriptional regulator [Nocardia]
MLETSARLLRLLSLLQIPRDWNGADLAERLEVSTRTVRNDIERLRHLGYPVHAARGSAGGYRLGAGASLPPLLLDDEEAVAVTIGLRTAAGGVAGVEEAALRALAKLEQVLPNRLRRRVSSLQTFAVVVPGDGTGPTVDAEILTALAAACRDHERLRFDYRDHNRGASRRVVEPYRLINWGRRWYLVAFDIDRGDWRTFRVDRITPKTPTGPRFTPRELPHDVTDRVTRGVSAAAWRFQASVTVHAAAEFLSARVPPAAGTVEPIDDTTCLLHTGADTPEALALNIGQLGMHGIDFTVGGPPELVELLRTLGNRYLRAVTAATRDPTVEGAHSPRVPTV